LLAFSLQVAAALTTLVSSTEAGAEAATTLLEIAGQVPSIDLVALSGILAGILGLGGFRTIEKLKGVARS